MEEQENQKDRVKDFVDTMKSIKENLDIDSRAKIIAIDYKDNMNIGGELTRKAVFVVKVQDEEGKIYHLVSDKDLNKIATIFKTGKIELSDREKKLWEQFIGKEDEQTLAQKQYYDFDKDYILDEYKQRELEADKDIRKEKIDDNLEQEENKKVQESKKKEEKQRKQSSEKDKQKEEMAKSLDMDSNSIKAIIKIEDRENFGQAINKKLYADTYIIKYGNNKTKLMQADSKGSFKEVSGLEYSDFSTDVLEELNINKSKDDLKIKAGDLKTIKTEDAKYNYVIVRENDPNKGIVIVNSKEKSDVYIFDDEGKENIRELETSIKYEVEKGKDNLKKNKESEELTHKNEPNKSKTEEKEEEDEGRTPWGDAYDRMNRH